VAYVKKQAGTDKTLVPITDIELIQDIKALDLLKEEVKALDYDPPSETAGEPGAIQLLEQKILATFAEMKIDEHSKPYIALPGGGAITCALVPGQFNGLDQARLRTEKPDVWKDYFISNKMTGKMSLRLYKPKPKK
jgi:hypothetical protein